MQHLKFLLILMTFLATCNLYPQVDNDDTSIELEIHKSNLEEGNHFYYNHIAMFIGVSSLFEREETHFTLGADYKRYFSPESNFAVGI